MIEVFWGSELNELIEEMSAHMRTQVENRALENSHFVFDLGLLLVVNFHQLNLTRGSPYLPLPDWILLKKVVINPQNEEDEECFKWAVLAALHYGNIDSHSERISQFRRFEDNYDWRGLVFPVPLNKIDIFEWNNNVSVNVLAAQDDKFYILRKSKFDDQRRIVDLLLIVENEKRDTKLRLRT